MIGILRRFREDEGGAGLLFGAVFLFVLVAVAAASMGVWDVLAAKVHAQNAADAVAYSASATVAASLSRLASLNGTLIWIYRIALGIIGTVVTTGVLSALNAAFPGMFAWAVPLFHQSLQTARQWLPRLFSAARRTAAAQDALVRATPALVQAQALRIARANGASAGAVFPLPKLPVERERNFDRFVKRLAGGAVPRWTVKLLFPEEAGAAGATERYSRSASRVVRTVHRGRVFDRTESQTIEEDQLEAGAQDPGTRGLLADYRRIMGEVRRTPLPLPLVLNHGLSSVAVQGVAWTEKGGSKGDLRFLTLAATSVRHPRIDPRKLWDDRDNLYVEEGWEIVWRPVDVKRIQRLDKGMVRRILGKEAGSLDAWIQH